jgi:tetratricopeptide (TPR) repeat protein
MSRETEMIFREFEKYMDEHGRPETEQDVNDMMQAFMLEYNQSVASREPLTPATASSADDYIDLAAQAASLDEAIGYAKRAVKLEPDNLDAELYYVALSAKDHFDRLNKIKRLVQKGNRMMKEQGYFDEEYIGAFWGFHQTRPYMRARQAYVDALLDVCMFEAAVVECEDMIRLSENDNIGARYTLMHLYALEGNEEKALELFDRYTEDGAMMLLPLAVLYYKKNDLKTSLKYLKQIMKHNPDLKKFLRSAAELGDPLPDDFDPSMYRPYTVDEINVAVFENDWLYMVNGMFFIWANNELNEKGRKNGSKKKTKKAGVANGKFKVPPDEMFYDDEITEMFEDV